MPDLSTITPVTREEEFLDRIARAAASPNLPEVDASDNGDVLTVVSGEWAAAAPAGGLPEVTSVDEGKVLTVVDNDGSYEWSAENPQANGLFVNILYDTTVPDTIRLYTDKTAGEIRDALLAGIMPVFNMSDPPNALEHTIFENAIISNLKTESVQGEPDSIVMVIYPNPASIIDDTSITMTTTSWASPLEFVPIT